MRPMPLPTVLWVLLVGGGLAACSTPPQFAAGGECAPTVEGTTVASYADYQAARLAFTRGSCDGAFVAVMEDVAWLHYEGDEESVLKAHRAYFGQGYTTFEVMLSTLDFTQPTEETFVLADSKGARLVGKPVVYTGSMRLENERFAARFQMSFRHAVTREIDWVSLTRVADGAELSWRFPWAPPLEPKGKAAACPTPLPASRPTNLMQPRNPAPEPSATVSGRPVNLIQNPAPAASFPAQAPDAGFPVPHTASVGEPAWSEPASAAGQPGVSGQPGAALPPAANFPAPAASPPPPAYAPPPVAAPAPSPPPAPGALPPAVVRRR